MPPRPPLAVGVLAGLAAVKLAVHLPLLGRYGYFRDELYFLDCGRHLGWGYVDCAPLIGLVAKAALLLGGSLPVLRAIPALAGAGLVVLTVLLARELGGGRFAQLLAGIAVIVVPVYLAMSSIMTMNAFEPLFWMGAVLLVVRIARTGDSRLWLLFGAVVGVGLENKHSTAFFAVAVAVAVLLTPLRRELRSPSIWLGAAVALALFAPNLIWQATHGFPTLVDLHNVRVTHKNVELPPGKFVVQQILMLHPVLLPLWVGGLWHLLVGRGRAFRALALVYLALLGAFMALHGKDYYLAPAYPMLLAAGATAFEGWTSRLRRTAARKALRVAVPAVVVAAGALTAPLVLPLLDPPEFVAYARRLGASPEKTEVNHVGPLPQIWGDQFGWPELVADVAKVYDALPPERRARTGIFASNYGEAGAIGLFGPRYGLPPAICAHQTYSMWGPPEFHGDQLIWLQWPKRSIERYCASVEKVGEHHDRWGMGEENRPIYLCRGLKAPLASLWPDLTHWN
jgi:hypothetical protein